MNQPFLSDTSATVIVQNTLKPPNDNPIQEGNILNEPLAASTNCNLINSQCIADAGNIEKHFNQSLCRLIAIKLG